MVPAARDGENAQRDRIDEWWNPRVPSGDSTRRALVGMSRKESTQAEALKNTQGFVGRRGWASWERRQGSAMNAPLRGAPLTPLPARGGGVFPKRCLTTPMPL